MTVLELTRDAIELIRKSPGLYLHHAIIKAADANNASEETVKQAFDLANVYAQLTRFRAQLQADELLAHINATADEIDTLEGERLPVRREQGYGAN